VSVKSKGGGSKIPNGVGRSVVTLFSCSSSFDSPPQFRQLHVRIRRKPIYM